MLWLVSLGTFMLLTLAPGDPAVAILGERATPSAIARIHDQLGLDLPLVTRYLLWLGDAAIGDLGQSLVPPGGSVIARVGTALPISAQLAVMAVVMALVVAVPLAVWSAYRRGGVLDRLCGGLSFATMSLPSFVSGLVLALLFAVNLNIFPRAQWVRLSAGVGDNLLHAILPAVCLALPLAAVYIRTLRSEMIQVLREPAIEFAYARGLPVRRVLFRYALPPASLSLLTLSGVSLGTLIGGTVVVETIYALPGLGHLLVGAVGASDYPLVQGIVLLIAVFYVLVNALIDASYALLDPRARHGR